MILPPVPGSQERRLEIERCILALSRWKRPGAPFVKVNGKSQFAAMIISERISQKKTTVWDPRASLVMVAVQAYGRFTGCRGQKQGLF